MESPTNSSFTSGRLFVSATAALIAASRSCQYSTRFNGLTETNSVAPLAALVRTIDARTAAVQRTAIAAVRFTDRAIKKSPAG